MMIRSAKSEELDVLMPIFEGAKAFMREAGNANQCLNGEEYNDKKKTPYEKFSYGVFACKRIA